MNCPNCNSILSHAGLQVCSSCGFEVLPIQVKAPKSQNYKERNAGKSRTLSSRTQLKKVSAKQKKKLSAYASSSSLQGEAVECAKCGCCNTLEKHHPYGRSGSTDGQLNIELWVWLCHGCHTWVHANANLAYEAGWLQPAYRGLAGENPKPWKKN